MEPAPMSTSRFTPTDLPRPSPPDAVSATIQDAATALGTTGRAAAFWAATALPFVHLPLLLYDSGDHALLVVALLALNALALVFGHDHDPGR